jgi:hypothetical protein
MDVQSLPSLDDHDPRKRLWGLEARPLLYVLVILASALAAYAYKLRNDGIFACSADGYSSDRYLAYCNASGYGEYDHGALWFDMEPRIPPIIARADVIFLGNSRLQYAFSNDLTADWFSSNAISYYLLGFAAEENGVFEGLLLRKFSPHAKLYIINADRFFEDAESIPAKAIFHDSHEARRYAQLKAWQYPHRLICSTMPRVCENKAVFYRSIESGRWISKDSVAYNVQPVSDGPASDVARWPEFIAFGEKFLAQLPVERKCVLLTIVPTVGTKRPEVTAIAGALGLTIIAPEVEGLQTWDGSHLDQPSGARWANEFFRAAGPLIRECAGSEASRLQAGAGL